MGEKAKVKKIEKEKESREKKKNESDWKLKKYKAI